MLDRRMPRRLLGVITLSLTMALSATSVQAAAVAGDTGTGRPEVQDFGDPLRGKKGETKPKPKDQARKAAVRQLEKATLPGHGVAQLTAGEKTPVKIGGLPITLTEASKPSNAAGGTRKGAQNTAPGKEAVSKFRVEVLDQQRAEQLGAGAVLRVKPVGKSADTRKSVRLTVDYSAFDEAYGGDYGARLRLVELPSCAAFHEPGSKACPAKPKELKSRNDIGSKTVAAEVSTSDVDPAPVDSGTTAPGARMMAADAAGSTMLALQAGASSSQGDFGATSLSPSASWSVAKSSGGFSWTYPLRTVPVPGGLAPTVGLGYSSQATDGRTSVTNNQGSWVGEGFSYEPGYVERAYKPCVDDGHENSAEQCWAFDNATLMLNGSASQIIKDDTTGEWRTTGADGTKVQKLTGATNGDDNGEHWKVTTPDGTEYYFGLNRLPGWASGNEETASAWTAPVFGDDSGEPCYNSTFTSAHCKQAWRWNLDYVKDTHGNVMSHYYARETNYYALNGKTDVNGTSYHRGGYLKRVDYGQRDGQVYAAKAPAQVTFTVAERCLPTADFDCAAEKRTAANASHWPDTPVDRECKANTACDAGQVSPSFFTTKRLTGVTTQMLTSTGTYQSVDAWTFTHLFTDNGDSSKTLWLSKIDHEGRVGTAIKLPSLLLQGMQFPNRVDKDGDNIDAFHRFRLVTVVSETGAQLDVAYAPTECLATALPKPGESTKRCYPVKWAPPGTLEPVDDWFHKYVVAEVTESDRTGGGDDMVTRYDYQGAAGWRHSEPDGITDEKFLTWGDWQGYGKVSVTSGSADNQRTRVDYAYLQGLDGDKDPAGGTRSASVTDSTGTVHTDHKEYVGFELEAATYNVGKVSSKVVNTPWKHDTAIQTKSWGTVKATLVRVKTSRGFTLLSGGGWRETKSTVTHDTSNGTGRINQINDLGDVSVPGDDTCTRTWYADNAGANILNRASRTETVAVNCSATPDRSKQVLSDERTFYDSGAFGAAPTKGDVTKTERLKSHDGTTAVYQETGSSTFDSLGRQLTHTSPATGKTTTVYTDTDGLTTSVKATNELTHSTVTDYAPAWGQMSGQTDANGRRTDLAFDSLGRITSVWLADRAKTQTPSIKYSYLIRSDAPVAVKTEKIEESGSYGVEYQLFDSLMRPRQMQAEGPGGTRLVADTFYDSRGKLKKTYATYNAVGAPSDQLLTVSNGDVAAQTAFEYDDIGRGTATIFRIAGAEQWRTTTVHDGELTHTDPPVGGVPTTVVTDAAGRTTELRQYLGSAPVPTGPASEYRTTKYTYTAAGHVETVTDPQGSTWRYEYDQRGRRVTTIDPDAGTTRTAYDDGDRPVSVTDARARKTSTVYDKLGRPTAVWAGEPGIGTKLNETRYDKAGWLGRAWASLSYTEGGQYFASVVQAMDEFYRPLKTAYSVPSSEGALAGTYVFTSAYNRDGTLRSTGAPAAGGLSSEVVDYGYDELQRPISASAAGTSYVTGTTWSPTSQLQQLELFTGQGKKVWLTSFYEKGTDRLTRSLVDIAGITDPGKSTQYSYDQQGNVLSIADTAGATPDVQCFAYDKVQRLAEAWTPAASGTSAVGSGTVGLSGPVTGSRPAACDSAPGAGPLGGPAAYWNSYVVDSAGNRTREVVHDTGLDTSKDITRTFTYGEGAAGPHAVTKVVENTPTGDRQQSYTYDAAGNTTGRTINGNTQTLDWDTAGRLSKVTEPDDVTTPEDETAETRFVYDAEGTRILREDPSGTTVYLPGMELTLGTGETSAKATRYYSFAGQTIAVRTNDGKLSFLAADHHGTADLAIDAATGAVSQRRFGPYGTERGKAVGVWPGETGFVGGTTDASTGLTHLGAREYDPGLGKFVSPDPLIDFTDPQQINAYAYANNTPVTLSDPTGLKPADCEEPGITCRPGPNGTWEFIVESDDKTKEQRKAETEVAQAEQGLASAKQEMADVIYEIVEEIKDIVGVDALMDCASNPTVGKCLKAAADIGITLLAGSLKVVLKANRVAKALKLLPRLYDSVRKWDKAGDRVDKAKDSLEKANNKARKERDKKNKKRKDSCENHSFLPGTQVLLADGTRKDIEDVELGEKVLVTDPETGEATAREVVRTIVTEDDKHFVDLTLATEDGNASIVSTVTHPFWVESEGDWVEAGDLKPGMLLRTPSGATLPVSETSSFAKRQRTHDLTVAGIHAYYVAAGSADLLVHNDDCMVRVGRWMSEAEYEAMVATGKVQAGSGGTSTYVAYPADSDAYRREAAPGSLYVEFDVPESSLKPAGKPGWKQIPGPNHPIYGRLNKKKGLPPPQMPKFKNLEVVDRK